ncbi:MAG: aminodeoxychorismate/anthranilate synthase component II [Candidatus Thiodiazotropha sp.]
MSVLIIDNYDSFTFNLFQLIGEVMGGDSNRYGNKPCVKVIRNDKTSMVEIERFNPSHIVISPGPGEPNERKYFGICREVILTMGKRVPILGVCLGMQGIASAFGGKIVRDRVPTHGKTSIITHDGKGVFSGLPQSLEVMRYHSLVADSDTLPDCLEVSAAVFTNGSESQDKMTIMGLRHREFPIEGVQFHPESFATEGSVEMIQNFLEGDRKRKYASSESIEKIGT